MPRSTASWISRAPSSSVLPCGMPSRLKPPQPRPATLTLRPVLPSVVYSMCLAAFLSEQTDRPPADRFSHASSDSGDPGKTRTCDPWFRKPMLYPAELRGLLEILEEF